MKSTNANRVVICADPLAGDLNLRARELSTQLNLPIALVKHDDCDLRLVVTPSKVELRVVRGELAKGHGVYSDLEAIDTTSAAGRSLNNPLLKAVGIKKGNPDRPRVLDCTAGLCEDAWLLSAFGCTVTAFERQPIVAAIAQDGIDRAAKAYPEIAERLTLHQGDARAWPNCLSKQTEATSQNEIEAFDAIVLDPMFPAGRKATERKAMRVLRMLAGDDADADELLDIALSSGAHRVAVKRSSHAPPIQNKRGPDVVYRGRAVRFDVYINA